MKKYLWLLALLLCFSYEATAANQSTIDPTIPATDSDLESEPIRLNFQAAWNDINSLWAALGSTLFGANQIAGTLSAGPLQPLTIPSCFGPSSALTWTNGVGFGCNTVVATGSVSSVAFVGDGIIDSAVPSVAVTNSGNVVATPLVQSPNTFLAGPTSGSTALPTWRLLTGADLPNPSLLAKGGVFASTAPTHNFVISLGTNGQLGYGQPLCGDLGNAGTACTANIGVSGAAVPLLNTNLTFSGSVNFAGALQIGGVAVAPSATIDTTNASNITSGSLAFNRLTPVAANQILGAITATTPSPLTVPSCSGGTNALTWTNGVGFGCNTISASGNVNAGTAGQIGYYATSGSSISPLTPGITLAINSSVANVTIPQDRSVGGNSDTITASDCAKTLVYTAASGNTAVSLAAASSTGLTQGCGFVINNKSAGVVTITPTTSTINNGSSLSIAPGTGCSIRSDSSNYQVDLSACSALQSPAGTLATTPADNATCTAGTMWWDTGFIYICTASGTVKRSALSTF